MTRQDSGDDWVVAARADALEEEAMMCTELHGRAILLARSGGKLYAADEMCTHEDASLCLGALRAGRVRCPLHGSWFDLATGDVDDDPATERLRVYPVRERDGAIEVRLADTEAGARQAEGSQ